MQMIFKIIYLSTFGLFERLLGSAPNIKKSLRITILIGMLLPNPLTKSI